MRQGQNKYWIFYFHRFLLRFQILHCLFLIVGIGSTMFHMTLKYVMFNCSKMHSYTLSDCRHSMQVLDEVPMIWGSCYMIYSMHMVTKKPGAVSYSTAAFLLSYCVLFAGVYLILQNPTIFQVNILIIILY